MTITVQLDDDPEKTVTVPVSAAGQNGASADDYSGVPASVTFNSGDTSKSFTFTAAADAVDDDGESVKLTFGTLPTGVTAGTTSASTVSITDGDLPDVTASFGAADLQRGRGRHGGCDGDAGRRPRAGGHDTDLQPRPARAG